MKNISLKNEYITITEKVADKKTGVNVCSYGGNQSWFKAKRISAYGCGVVAVCDIILYLTKRHNIEKTEYMRLVRNLSNSFFFLPPITRGKTGIGLCVGFNLYAAAHRLPYRAYWGLPGKDVKKGIINMLSKNIPVLFSVGANFPFVWRKKGIKLYEFTDNRFVERYTVLRHYMVITGIITGNDGIDRYQVSNWGRKFYIECNEYEEFIRKNSCALFSSILYLLENKSCDIIDSV